MKNPIVKISKTTAFVAVIVLSSVVASSAIAGNTRHVALFEARVGRMENVLVNDETLTVESRARIELFLQTMQSKINATRPVEVAVSEPVVVTTPDTPETEPVHYSVVFDGYGEVRVDEANDNVFLSPIVATSPQETHAGLVVSQTSLQGDFSVSYTINTDKQLRIGSTPNPWETGWFVFGYKPDGTFKYLILKPDGYGIELGESLGNDAQNFLWTSRVGDDSFNIGQSYEVTLEVRGNEIILSVDGVERLRYQMTSKDLLDTNGKYGFYTEDASVTFSDIQIGS